MRHAATILCALACPFVAHAQTPASSDQFGAIWSALAGDTAMKQGTVYLAPPLALTPDPATGRRWLTAAAPAAIVRNEVPARSGDGWTLAHVPTSAGASCYRNGVRQAPGGFDYTLTANAIASAFWQAGDTLVCDYEWLPGSIPKPAAGVITLTLTGASTYDLSLDGAVLAHRVPVPAAAGTACPGPNVWAGDLASFWFCAPVLPGSGAYAWQRVAVVP